MTLQWRLTLFYAGLVALVLLVVSVSVVGVMRQVLLQNVQRTLQTDLALFDRLQYQFGPFRPLSRDASGGFSDSNPLAQLGLNFPDDAIQIDTFIVPLEEVRSDPLPDVYNFRTIGGGGLSKVDPQNPFVLSDADFERLRRSATGSIFVSVPWQRGGEGAVNALALVRLGYVSSEPSLEGGLDYTAGITWFVRDVSGVDSTLSTLTLILLFVFVVATLLAGVVAYLLAGRALLPLRQVQRAAEGIGGRTLGQRVPEPATHDEVQSLAHALNNMLDRLEQSFETQRRFTSDASHELRTPVTAISGHAGYLLRRTSPTAQQSESLNIIKNEADRLTALIGSLLELARSDSGAIQLRPQPVLAQLFLQDIARELRPLAQAQGAQVQAEGGEVVFLADPDRLKQVLLNLVSNALKAGARTVRLGSRQEGSDVLLSVADDGPGIAAEHLERLFDRFYRVDESRARDAGGAGLGLAIVKAIVDAHEGRIWIESELGKGTTVFVRLPIGQVDAAGDEAEEVQARR